MDNLDARRYDCGMKALERVSLSRLRRALLADARGDILEIGVGTGANLQYYPHGGPVAALDLRPALLDGAIEKARRYGRGRSTIVACVDAQQLSFPDNIFDTIVGTLVFCSIKEPEAALAEVRRVLKPGGRLLLIEHVRGQTPFSRKVTDWLHPVWFAVQGVCHLNRETAATIAAAGFHLDHVSTHTRGFLQMIKASSVGEPSYH